MRRLFPTGRGQGEKAVERSASLEAISHLTKGLALLKTLPDTPDSMQQELTLQIALGAPLLAVQGLASSEAEQVYSRARTLCLQLGETPQLFRVLLGLGSCYLQQGRLPAA